MTILTKQEALRVIILFIKMYCDETGSNDAKKILNNLVEQNKTIENKVINLSYYLDSARKMIFTQPQNKLSATNDESFSEQEIFEAMILLLEEYYYKTNSNDLGAFLGDLLHDEYGETADDAAWEKWQECINQIISER